MRIAIIGATGRAGSLMAKEALSRGHHVTAVVRDRSHITNTAIHAIEKDLFDLTTDDLKAFDVVIDAFGAWKPETIPLHQTSLKHLADILAGTEVRLLVVGGAGSLYGDNGHTKRVMDSPDFPKEALPLVSSMAKAFDALRIRNDVNWTYFSPALNFIADGPRTGSYQLGDDQPVMDGKGISEISYADYAIAMIDEAERGAHVRKRFTAAWK